ncbi:PTS sugar transporter subunit IIA [Roseivivax sp. CAU 1761]
MNVMNLLEPGAVRVISGATSKKRLMHDIAETAASAYRVDYDRTLEALMERESLGPTGVGHGVALPHARLSGLDAVRGAFILLEKPIEFEAVDRQPVDLVFALFAPEDAGVEHLKALALVSRTLRDGGFCNKLRANPDPAKLFTILTEVTPSQAA